MPGKLKELSSYRKPVLTRASVFCLIIALACAISAATIRIIGNKDIGKLSILNEQIDATASDEEQLTTLQERFDKRVSQLAEAQAALDGNPTDSKLASKLERAQGEYDKALKNLNKQLSKMEGKPTVAELNVELTAVKAGTANSLLVSNALFLLAILCTAVSYVFMMGGGIRQYLPVIGLLIAGAVVLWGVHLNNLCPSLKAGETLPGSDIIVAGYALFALFHAFYWSFVTRSKFDCKLILGIIVIFAGAALIIQGHIQNNVPDVKELYVNAMSPGFLYLLGGGVLFAVGTLIIALPLVRLRYDIRKNPLLVLMALPSVVYFLITSYLPMVGIYFGFTNYRFTANFFTTLFGGEFVGFGNFRYLFASGIAWKMTVNTIIYNLIFIVGGTIMKVAIAIMFSEISGKRYKKFVQTASFLPHFISMVMVGTFAYSLLNYNSGLINSTLVKLGLERVDFYSIPWAWYIIIPLFDCWKGVGYGSIIYVSAIMGISDELYEAADLDGASFWQEIIHVTLPCIRPTIVILTLMSLGNIMRGNFDLFYQLVGRSGQLYNTTEIIDTYVWRALRENVQIGMGSASGLYQSFVGMILVVLVNTIVKKIEPDYAIF